jgi:hypothetical protein
MKKLLILFGLLDIISIIRSYRSVAHLLTSDTSSLWLQVPNLLLFVSLGFSAYFLLRQSKAGLLITYVQFPFRIAFGILSFGFLFAFNTILDLERDSNILGWILLGLECGRLFLTVLIHRKFYTTSLSMA